MRRSRRRRRFSGPYVARPKPPEPSPWKERGQVLLYVLAILFYVWFCTFTLPSHW